MTLQDIHTHPDTLCDTRKADYKAATLRLLMLTYLQFCASDRHKDIKKDGQ